MDGLAGVELTGGCWKTSKLHVAPITGLDYLSTWQALSIYFGSRYHASFETSLKTSEPLRIPMFVRIPLIRTYDTNWQLCNRMTPQKAPYLL